MFSLKTIKQRENLLHTASWESLSKILTGNETQLGEIKHRGDVVMQSIIQSNFNNYHDMKAINRWL